MPMGQAQDLPLQGWCCCPSVGATLVVARSKLPVSKTQQTGQAQDLPLQGWRCRTSVGATLVVARSMLPYASWNALLSVSFHTP
jgi:hypothetical protein